MGQYAEWAEAFTIFEKYVTGYQEIAAEHDVVYAGPLPEIVSDEDKDRLEQLGWTPDEYSEGFSSFT